MRQETSWLNLVGSNFVYTSYYWFLVVGGWLLLVLIRFSKAINILLTWTVAPINSVYCAAVMYFSS